MPISINSLRALPPKQALVLALMERQRRHKRLQDQQMAILARMRNAEREDPFSIPIEFANVPSLVLDPNHKLHCLLTPAPYKVLWGGRSSTKSWGVAEALIRKAAVSPVLVLCTREFQNSIKDSSHRLLVATIKRLGMEAHFDVTKESITSKVGAEFIFRGLHGAEHSMRSLEGVDICWVEEGQSVSEASWRSLIPTIRKDTAEVWITFNLMDTSDATYQRFVAHPPTGAIVVKLTYLDNPYMSAKARQDMEDDKARDYQMYEHVWLGMELKVSDAIIFNRKYVVREFDDELWKEAQRPFYGVDFGFSQDPMAVERFFPIENDADGKRRLYVSHEAYATRVELDEMPEFMDSVPGIRDWPVFADSARPETISHLRRRGFNIDAAEKWEGCVKDGITHLRGFDEIVIHPRCTGLALEARAYRYKTDPKQVDDHGNPKVLPIVIDANNHGWDAIRYGFNGYIMRSGALDLWTRLAG